MFDVDTFGRPGEKFAQHGFIFAARFFCGSGERVSPALDEMSAEQVLIVRLAVGPAAADERIAAVVFCGIYALEIRAAFGELFVGAVALFEEFAVELVYGGGRLDYEVAVQVVDHARNVFITRRHL